MKKSTHLITLFVTSILFAACKPQEKFDKEKWQQPSEGLACNPYREEMLDDLLENYHLEGKTYKAICNLLGPEELYRYGDTLKVEYHVLTDFGWNIDPQHTMDLELFFNKDSIVTSCKVREWHAE